MRRVWFVAALLVLASVAAACGGDDDTAGTPGISVERAVIPPPSGANGALYVEVANQGDGDDTLIEVRTGIAETVELHRTVEGDDGLARMEEVDEVEVPAGGTVSLAPGGLHVMLFDVQSLDEGDTVEVELVFERSGTLSARAEVGPWTDGGD